MNKNPYLSSRSDDGGLQHRRSGWRAVAIVGCNFLAFIYLVYYLSWIRYAIRGYLRWRRDADYMFAELLHATPVLLACVGFIVAAFKIRSGTTRYAWLVLGAAFAWTFVCIAFQEYTRPWLNIFSDVHVNITAEFELPPAGD